MHCLVTVCKHVNNIRAIASIEKLLEAVFFLGSASKLYNEYPRPASWIRLSSVMGYSPDINDVSTEAEEYPLLRSITKKRLAKADWEDLACALGICKMYGLAIAL
jgi:hypothetical protein